MRSKTFRVHLTIFVFLIAMVGCGSSSSRVVVTIRNEGAKPATLWANERDPKDPQRYDWIKLGVVGATTNKDFEISLGDLAAGQNIRLQPGAGPVKMTELSAAKLAGSHAITVIMHADESMAIGK